MILCDTHADTLHRMAVEPKGRYDLSLERLRAGGVSLQVMAMYVGKDPAPDKVAALFEKMLAAKDRLLREGWLQTMIRRSRGRSDTVHAVCGGL